jgi:hypothetical protein
MEKGMVQFQEAKTHDLGLVLHDFTHTQAQLTSDTADAWWTDTWLMADVNFLNSLYMSL